MITTHYTDLSRLEKDTKKIIKTKNHSENHSEKHSQKHTQNHSQKHTQKHTQNNLSEPVNYKYYVKNFKMTCQIETDETNEIPIFNFPYKIERGVSQQYIALDILKKNNFDEDIIKEAIKISKKVIKPTCM